MDWTPAQLAALPGPGDFDPPDPECVKRLLCCSCWPDVGEDALEYHRETERCADCGVRSAHFGAVCATHDQPWSECGGADSGPFDQEPFE